MEFVCHRALEEEASVAVEKSCISQLDSAPFLGIDVPYEKIQIFQNALDFSKAFDSVRQSTVLKKYSFLDLPDNIYNWIVEFFRDRKHCTRFNETTSKFCSILASIIQGSVIGPASYVVAASDLQLAVSGNTIDKYADDTYLIIPAVNSGSCGTEITRVEKWSAANNLSLNRSKSVEIVFVAPRSKRAVSIPPPEVSGFQRVDSIKILGVTVSRKFALTDHVDHLLAAVCAVTVCHAHTETAWTSDRRAPSRVPSHSHH